MRQTLPEIGKWTVVIGGLGLAGCGASPSTSSAPESVEPSGDRPLVVATNGVICDLVQQIAADTLDLTCLLEAGQDPHVYRPTPSDRRAIEEADLVLYDGYNYAPGVIQMVTSANTAGARVAVYEVAVPEPLLAAAHDHSHGDDDHGQDDHGHGKEEDHGHDDPGHDDPGHDDPGHGEAEQGHADHGHGDADALVPDPHIYQSAVNSAAIAELIGAELVTLNPTEADRYQTRTAELSGQFLTLDDWIREQVATVPEGNRQLVTTHDAFRYFADAYGFEFAGALSGLSTQEQPTAARLTALVDQIKVAQVPAIFAESATNPQVIQTVAQEAGVTVPDQVLYVAGPGETGSSSDTLQAMLVSNTCVIVTGLGGTCDPASAPY